MTAAVLTDVLQAVALGALAALLVACAVAGLVYQAQRWRD
jgi:hypothetical protein